MSHQVCGNLLQQQEKTNTGSTKKRNTQVTLNPKPSGPTHSSVFPNTLRQNPKYSFGYEWDMAQTVHFETTQTLALFLSLSCSSQSDVQLTFSASTKTDWFISLETTKREGLGHGLSTPALLTFWTRSFFCSGDCSVHCRDT